MEVKKKLKSKLPLMVVLIVVTFGLFMGILVVVPFTYRRERAKQKEQMCNEVLDIVYSVDDYLERLKPIIVPIAQTKLNESRLIMDMTKRSDMLELFLELKHDQFLEIADALPEEERQQALTLIENYFSKRLFGLF